MLAWQQKKDQKNLTLANQPSLDSMPLPYRKCVLLAMKNGKTEEKAREKFDNIYPYFVYLEVNAEQDQVLTQAYENLVPFDMTVWQKLDASAQAPHLSKTSITVPSEVVTAVANGIDLTDTTISVNPNSSGMGSFGDIGSYGLYFKTGGEVLELEHNKLCVKVKSKPQSEKAIALQTSLETNLDAAVAVILAISEFAKDKLSKLSV